jgi:segregation and condensation protein B
MSDNINNKDNLTLLAKLEALLFVATGAVTMGQLASALETTTRQIEIGLDLLDKRYNQNPNNYGLRLQKFRSRIQLTTAPELATLIERYLDLDSISRLSKAALETLAIVAYQQPVSRPEVDSIRGVNSDTVLKTLLGKGLIEEVGRAQRPGRPILYSTTTDFLQYFGLTSLDELPPLNFDKSLLDKFDSDNV